MSGGYRGKVLRVDLSQEKFWEERPEESFYRRYVGGRGFVAYYLLKELKPGVDALGSENRLIFAAGVVAGAPIGGAARNSVGAKSPLTGAYGDAEVGGYWGTELKAAGWDAIVIEGKASRPVYLWIKDSQAQLRDASHLWGKLTAEVEGLIRQELGDRDVKVAQIGPSGEQLVRYACILNDLRHAAGRTGLGAVMGSKNLRAIAVRGSQRLPLAQPREVHSLAKWLRDNVLSIARMRYEYGTAGAVAGKQEQGTFPAYNHRESVFEGWKELTGQTWEPRYLAHKRGCYACPIRCKRELVEKAGPYSLTPAYGGPEYETIGAFGSNCGIGQIEPVLKAHDICNAYGVDTISAGGAVAFAMECFEQGLLTPQDTGGLKLSFGNIEAMLAMTEMIARREGLGRLLGEGVVKAAQEIGNGADKYAIHVKGQQPALQEPRVEQGMGLGYAVSPIGADHNNNMHDIYFAGPSMLFEEVRSLGILEPLPIDDLGPGKVRMLAYHINFMNLLNCLVWCRAVPLEPEQLAQLTRAVTGWNTTVFELMKVGQRANTMAQAFNIREGIDRRYDTLPQRWFTPVPTGPRCGMYLTPEKLERGKDLYYRIMGWDEATGAPKRGTLEELDIPWVAEQLVG